MSRLRGVGSGRGGAPTTAAAAPRFDGIEGTNEEARRRSDRSKWGNRVAGAAALALLALARCKGASRETPPGNITPDSNRQLPAKSKPTVSATAPTMAKDCCMGRNSCRGRGGCGVPESHACAGKNACAGEGGCNAHCPK